MELDFEPKDEAVNPLKGQSLDELQTFIASLLLKADSKNPVTSDQIIAKVRSELYLTINLRKFHDIIRYFRKDLGLPVLSRRSKPAGYWWCRSINEMSEFALDFLSQAKDEFHTVSRMVSKNYPRLAGQLKLDLQP